MKRHSMSTFFGTAMALVACSSCGQSGMGRFEVSGTVTYHGRPLPAGRIVFEPDTQKGNRGPASIAEVDAGRFRTRESKGAVGGPHRVTVYGYDGTQPTETHDTALFGPRYFDVDLPFQDSSHDFEIP